MSARHGMSCESCRDLLMELVCEELDAETGAAVRAHALTCERCGPELAKLERTLKVSRELPLLSPSPEVERRIMQAARDAIAGRAKGPARETSTAPKSSFSAWFARIGTWAMSPQVATASVLLLVVGIGLYSLPMDSEPHQAALRETEEDGASKQAPAPAASATAAPTPEPVAADRANEAEEPAAKGAFPAEKSKVATAPARRDSEVRARKSAGGAAYDALEDALGGTIDNTESKRARPQSVPAANAPSEAYAAKPASPKKEFAPPPPAPAPSPSAPGAELERSASRSEEVAAEGAVRGPSKDDTGGTSDLAEGIAAARRGEYARSRQLLLPVAKHGTALDRSQANLWLARGYKSSGNCAAALPFYKVLTQALTASREVLDEAAECFEQTGNATQAIKLRARATSNQ